MAGRRISIYVDACRETRRSCDTYAKMCCCQRRTRFIQPRNASPFPSCFPIMTWFLVPFENVVAPEHDPKQSITELQLRLPSSSIVIR